MSSESDFHGRLGVMRRSFVEQLPKRLADLETALARWLASGAEADLAAFHRLVHNLTGAGGTYGFPGLSEAAQVLEQEIKVLMATRAVPEVANTELLRRLMTLVTRVIAEVQLKSAPEGK